MLEDNSIDAQLLDIMLRTGSRWVLWLLLGLSLAAVAVIIERIWFFIQERAPRDRIDLALRTFRERDAATAAGKLTGARSMQAAVARACLESASDGAPAVEEHKAAVLEQERLRYERRLAFLGTLGNNAPFIGLFGTVLGIVRAFSDLAGSTVQGTQAVMSGIAEALVATAIGLLVALPSVATYNAFTRRVEIAFSDSEAIAHRILAQIKTARAPESAPEA